MTVKEWKLKKIQQRSDKQWDVNYYKYYFMYFQNFGQNINKNINIISLWSAPTVPQALPHNEFNTAFYPTFFLGLLPFCLFFFLYIFYISLSPHKVIAMILGMLKYIFSEWTVKQSLWNVPKFSCINLKIWYFDRLTHELIQHPSTVHSAIIVLHFHHQLNH